MFLFSTISGDTEGHIIPECCFQCKKSVWNGEVVVKLRMCLIKRDALKTYEVELWFHGL